MFANNARYSLRYTNRYASKIYHILSNTKKLLNQLDRYNIISIRCGPATEAIAIEKVFRDNNISPFCNYYGYDPNPIQRM
ncbi:hypothetical protein FACS1894110_13830 [Spirochaetia bacterium]|nr:hypothetical protein FACS1894110_13830 [Spirochaetia bacterium]